MIKRISLKIGLSLILLDIFWNIWGQQHLDPQQILPYQIFNFLHLYFLNDMYYPQIMSVGNVSLLIIGIIFLAYGRIDRFILSRNHEQKIILLKIFIVIVIMGLSSTFMFNAINIMNASPYLFTPHSRFIYLDHQNITGTFQINLRSNEMVQESPIPTDVIVKLNEPQNMSSIVNIQFPDAEISYSMNDTQIENKTVQLSKKNSNGAVNTYYAGPILSYPNDGKFNAILIIENNSSKKVDTKPATVAEIPLNSLITVHSFESYQIQEQNNYSNGLSLLVIGLSIIVIASIITKLVDYFDRYFIIQKARFYE